MSNYKHIIAAVDFSPEYESVLAKAVEFARQHGAALTLINVVECTEAAYAGDLIMPADVTFCQELAQQAEERLDKARADHKVPDARTVVRTGVPKHEILQTAEELQADLIIVGSHGRHGFQLILGSTANGILHLAKCDVLAVRIPD